MVTTSQTVRFATFNVAMSADAEGEIFNQLHHGENPRFANIAAIIQHVRPDVLLLCEFDHPGNGGDDGMLAYFQRHYLEVSQYGNAPISYPYHYLPATNTGLPVVEGDDVSISPERAHGFGRHHGQYGFVVLSRYPLKVDDARRWQTLPWSTYPRNHMPVAYFEPKGLSSLRLSSKNHIVLPVEIGGQRVQLVACHPTPPVFDGEEKRNYWRNADELRLLQDIVEGAEHLVDDIGQRGGISGEAFVIMGDLNADPSNGDGHRKAIQQLLASPRVKDALPASQGAAEYFANRRFRGKAHATHNRGWRLDYVLPSSGLTVSEAGVFWPARDSDTAPWVLNENGKPSASLSSDHRLVWVDIQLP